MNEIYILKSVIVVKLNYLVLQIEVILPELIAGIVFQNFFFIGIKEREHLVNHMIDFFIGFDISVIDAMDLSDSVDQEYLINTDPNCFVSKCISISISKSSIKRLLDGEQLFDLS